MTEVILNNIISQLYESHFTVVAVTSDMGTGNISLWKQLNVGHETCCFFCLVEKQDIASKTECDLEQDNIELEQFTSESFTVPLYLEEEDTAEGEVLSLLDNFEVKEKIHT